MSIPFPEVVIQLGVLLNDFLWFLCSIDLPLLPVPEWKKNNIILSCNHAYLCTMYSILSRIVLIVYYTCISLLRSASFSSNSVALFNWDSRTCVSGIIDCIPIPILHISAHNYDNNNWPHYVTQSIIWCFFLTAYLYFSFVFFLEFLHLFPMFLIQCVPLLCQLLFGIFLQVNS